MERDSHQPSPNASCSSPTLEMLLFPSAVLHGQWGPTLSDWSCLWHLEEFWNIEILEVLTCDLLMLFPFLWNASGSVHHSLGWGKDHESAVHDVSDRPTTSSKQKGLPNIQNKNNHVCWEWCFPWGPVMHNLPVCLWGVAVFLYRNGMYAKRINCVPYLAVLRNTEFSTASLSVP